MSDDNDVFRLLRSVLDGQKAMLETFRTVATRHEETRAELAQISKQQGTLLDMMRSLEGRADATYRRLDEIENRIEAGFRRTHELQKDVIAQENQVLNALDAAITNTANATELEERVQQIEVRLGMG